jgi:hypothetical protein
MTGTHVGTHLHICHSGDRVIGVQDSKLNPQNFEIVFDPLRTRTLSPPGTGAEQREASRHPLPAGRHCCKVSSSCTQRRIPHLPFDGKHQARMASSSLFVPATVSTKNSAPKNADVPPAPLSPPAKTQDPPSGPAVFTADARSFAARSARTWSAVPGAGEV